jgi:thiamine kinase-like enzyme
MQTYKDWPLLDELPEGWAIDKTAGSPLHGYEFCTNGKSVVSGKQKRALFRVFRPQLLIDFDAPEKKPLLEKQAKKDAKQIIDSNYVRTVNELARQEFKHRLLNDILVDLTICEIEGWCKLEYINEMRKLINGIGQQVCIGMPNAGVTGLPERSVGKSELT